MARCVEMAPIESITVLNPRSRNKKQHRDIVENIDNVGLKRPITARKRIAADGTARYEVVCGEGRLEAFRALNQDEVPVVVVDGTEADCLVMSLVENIARRSHRPIDLIQEIGSLRQRGHSDGDIAGRIGVTPSYVNMVGRLIEQGEERLVAAVEGGLIPISFAIDIARITDTDAQRALAEAYADGKLKGKNIAAIRRLLEIRARNKKAPADSGFGRTNSRRTITADELVRLYEREIEKYETIVRKADFAKDRLLFIVESLRRLFLNENFINALRAEQLNTIPKILQEHMDGRAVA